MASTSTATTATTAIATTSTVTTPTEEERIRNEMDINNYEIITDKSVQLSRWVFTLFNYTNEDENLLKEFGNKYCKYLIYGIEKAPTTGNPHLQGYINLLKRLTFNQMISILGTKFRFYKAKKNDLANYRYCSKSMNFYFYQAGLVGTMTEKSKETLNERKKKSSTKERMEIAWELARKEHYEEIDKDLLIKYGDKFKYINVQYYYKPPKNLFYDQGEKNYFKCHNLWLWGKTGVGKSFFLTYMVDGINEWWKKRCEKDNKPFVPLRVYEHQLTRWWDKWRGEEIVVFNEVNPLFCSWYANEIKQWCDQYPFNAEVKGGSLQNVRHRFTIFTSNYHMKDCFVKTKGREIILDEKTNKPIEVKEDLEPMKRRMMSIYRTDKHKNKIINWPNFKKLDEYHDSITKFERQLEFIKWGYCKLIQNPLDSEFIHCEECGYDQYDCQCFHLDYYDYCHICEQEKCECGRIKYNLNKCFEKIDGKESNWKNVFINWNTSYKNKEQNNSQKISFVDLTNEDNTKTPTKTINIDLSSIQPSTPIKKSRLSLKNKGKKRALENFNILNELSNTPTKKTRHSSFNNDDSVNNIQDTPTPKPKEINKDNSKHILCIDCYEHDATVNHPYCKNCKSFINYNVIQGKAQCRYCKQYVQDLQDAHCYICTYELQKKYEQDHPGTFNIELTQIIDNENENENKTEKEIINQEQLSTKNKNNKNKKSLSQHEIECRKIINKIRKEQFPELYNNNNITCTEHRSLLILNIPWNESKQKQSEGDFDLYGIKFKTVKQANYIYPKIKEIFNINKTIQSLITIILTNNQLSIFSTSDLKNKINKAVKDKQSKIDCEIKLNDFVWRDSYLPDNIDHTKQYLEIQDKKTLKYKYDIEYFKTETFDLLINTTFNHFLEEDEYSNNDDFDFDIYQENKL